MSLSTTNLTIDDISSDILYSSGWAISNSTADPQISNFFEGTYHSTQVAGASANISFIGYAIYIFGTKGPTHANYTVYADSKAISLSAYASQTEFRALLFSYSSNSTTTTTHFISIIAEPVPGREWLDIDYIAVTVNQSTGIVGPLVQPSQTAPITQSAIPPWKSDFSTGSAATSSTTAIPFTASETGRSSSPLAAARLTFTLSLLFGSILIVILLCSILLYFRRLAKSQNLTSLFSPGHSLSGRQGSREAEMARPPQMTTVNPRGFSPYKRDGISFHQSRLALATNARSKEPCNVRFGRSSEDPFSRDMVRPEDSNNGRHSPAHSVISRESATIAGSTTLLYINGARGGGGNSGAGRDATNGNLTTAPPSSSQLAVSRMPLVAQHRPRSSGAGGVTADNNLSYRDNKLRSEFSDSHSDIRQPAMSTVAATQAKQKSCSTRRPKQWPQNFLGWISESRASTFWKRDWVYKRGHGNGDSDWTGSSKA